MGRSACSETVNANMTIHEEGKDERRTDERLHISGFSHWLWIRKAGRPSSAGQLVLLGELRALKGFALGTNAEKLKRPRERQKERVDIRTFLGELDRRSRRLEPDTRSELQRRTQRGVPHVVGLAR